MADEADPFEHIAFLSRSKTRVRLLSQLSDRGAMTRRDLRDELETSQSTIVRSLQALKERGWVETENGAVRITATGGVTVEAFQDLVDTIAGMTELDAFLRWFPHDEFDLELSHLCGATVTTATSGDPYAPGRTQTELLRDAAQVRMLLPSIELEGTKVIHDRITAGELEAEVIVGPDVNETIRHGEYAQLFREKLQTGRLSLSAIEEPLPFFLGLFDAGDVQLGVEDDDGMPQTLLETDDERVREWGEDVYKEYRDRATVLSGEDF